MKDVKAISSLSFGAIACNAALFCVLCYNTNFSNKEELIAFFIAGFGIIMAVLYAVQLILMKRFYYRHHIISLSAKIFLHICRTITLLYSLLGAILLTTSAYYSSRQPAYMRASDYRFMAALGLILVTVVMNFTIFFKGWRLLKMVRTPYIEKVIASFD